LNRIDGNVCKIPGAALALRLAAAGTAELVVTLSYI
jgi:hypothetical protein